MPSRLFDEAPPLMLAHVRVGAFCVRVVNYAAPRASVDRMPAFASIDANGFCVTWCPLCGGSSHPSTGCAYSDTFVVCWSCTRAACRWIHSWTNARGRRTGINFYDHVGD